MYSSWHVASMLGDTRGKTKASNSFFVRFSELSLCMSHWCHIYEGKNDVCCYNYKVSFSLRILRCQRKTLWNTNAVFMQVITSRHLSHNVMVMCVCVCAGVFAIKCFELYRIIIGKLKINPDTCTNICIHHNRNILPTDFNYYINNNTKHIFM